VKLTRVLLFSGRQSREWTTWQVDEKSEHHSGDDLKWKTHPKRFDVGKSTLLVFLEFSSCSWSHLQQSLLRIWSFFVWLGCSTNPPYVIIFSQTPTHQGCSCAHSIVRKTSLAGTLLFYQQTFWLVHLVEKVKSFQWKSRQPVNGLNNTTYLLSFFCSIQTWGLFYKTFLRS
jgi:hypothetical protein